jgi:hypothetical protein
VDGCYADDVHGDACGLARGGDDARVAVRGCGVAEDKRTDRHFRQRQTRTEAIEVDKVQQQLDSIGGDPLFANQPIDTHFVDGNISPDGGMDKRHFLPRYPSMAEVDDRRVGKCERRDQGLDMVVAVDHVRRLPYPRHIVHHRNRCRTQFVGNGAEHEAERHRTVSAPLQCECDVADVDFGARALTERVIREEDGDRWHRVTRTPIRGSSRSPA